MEVSFYELDSIKDIKVAPSRKMMEEFMPIFTEHNKCKPKAVKKLPTWVEKRCIFANRPFEQCTAEEIANYRSSKFSDFHILSLTGGMGVDDVAFEKNGNRVTSLDPDSCLNALFEFNAAKLGAKNIQRFTTTAEEFLAQNQATYQMVFIDPDRRTKAQRATSNIADYSPNIFELYKTYQMVAPIWLLKLSPMTDIDWLHNQFADKVDLEVICTPNEVKEIMLTLSKEARGLNTYVVVDNGLVSKWDGNGAIDYEKVSENVFFEPAPGILKCNFQRHMETIFQMKALNKYHTFFMGNALLPRWLGRSFRLLETIEGSLGAIQARLNALDIKQANITARNFVLDAVETRKKLNLKDGGEIYIFFTGKIQKVCYVCRKY